MEYAVLGWPPDGPTLSLDHRQFAYAGKFVMSNTGKAVVRVDGEVVGAVAFNEDRTDASTLWLRYITVQEDTRGDGLGPRLARFVVARARERGYDRVTIAVNNPFAYDALWKAGFSYTGTETGVAELVLATDADRDRESYEAGLDVFHGRDLSAGERSFLDERTESGPPETVSTPE